MIPLHLVSDHRHRHYFVHYSASIKCNRTSQPLSPLFTSLPQSSTFPSRAVPHPVAAIQDCPPTQRSNRQKKKWIAAGPSLLRGLKFRSPPFSFWREVANRACSWTAETSHPSTGLGSGSSSGLHIRMGLWDCAPGNQPRDRENERSVSTTEIIDVREHVSTAGKRDLHSSGFYFRRGKQPGLRSSQLSHITNKQKAYPLFFPHFLGFCRRMRTGRTGEQREKTGQHVIACVGRACIKHVGPRRDSWSQELCKRHLLFLVKCSDLTAPE